LLLEDRHQQHKAHTLRVLGGGKVLRTDFSEKLFFEKLFFLSKAGRAGGEDHTDTRPAA
jgi:hypothetical protein